MSGNGDERTHGGRRAGAGRKFISVKVIRCFRCGHKVKVEKKCHPRYTYCPKCRREVRQFWPGMDWIDHGTGRMD